MNLEEEVKKVNWSNSSDVIDFYESHKLFFNNTDSINDEKTISAVISIMYHYANSLFLKNHFNRVYPVIDKAKKLLNKVPRGSNDYSTLYENLLFLEARTLNNHKLYRKAKPLFEELVVHDPDNISYREWYLNNKISMYDIYFYTSLSIGVSLILIDIVFAFLHPIPIDLGLIGLGFIGVLYFVYKLFVRRVKSKLVT